MTVAVVFYEDPTALIVFLPGAMLATLVQDTFLSGVCGEITEDEAADKIADALCAANPAYNEQISSQVSAIYGFERCTNPMDLFSVLGTIPQVSLGERRGHLSLIPMTRSSEWDVAVLIVIWRFFIRLQKGVSKETR